MTASGLSVLVVEDEPLIRLILASALEDEGYIVHEAGTVLQAVAALSKFPIDAVVTDVDMPGGLSGLDLGNMVAGLPMERALIVTSGRLIETDEGLPQEAVFIPKPYELRSIVDLLERELFRLRLAITPESLRTASKM